MLKSLLRKLLLKELLGATAIAAMTCAFVPAHAAGIGCSGKDQASAEGKVEGMADGPAKFAAQRHIAAAQEALLKDRMHDCAMHLSMAMQAASIPEAPYAGTAPYAGAMAEAPYPGTRPYYAGPAPYTDTMAQAPYGAPYPDTMAEEGPDYYTPY